ncbi:hypothetical protein DFP93_102443 [Aneurinibacillus soli]|uniref:Uncharacterized protein n=1 Tax=Aneurinibacillus soli TaxID=1500254 RepID=A0A0U5AYH6_9BACL|nr:hypothetical protein [Aneurinibacillus soli]PYE63753.1 hypothetical protein DFP93_102443 [Aneurinibacillus soli]BAU27314.1 hypothetical protein CB4_01488 [Aneurinibacillus soli]
MKVGVEGTGQQYDMAGAKELTDYLHEIKAKRLFYIAELHNRIERYEKRRAQQQAAYHKMSSIRKLFSGKAPDHHLAVEYMVYVRQPMQEIAELTVGNNVIDGVLVTIENGADTVCVPVWLSQEILNRMGRERLW